VLLAKILRPAKKPMAVNILAKFFHRQSTVGPKKSCGSERVKTTVV